MYLVTCGVPQTATVLNGRKQISNTLTLFFCHKPKQVYNNSDTKCLETLINLMNMAMFYEQLHKIKNMRIITITRWRTFRSIHLKTIFSKGICYRHGQCFHSAAFPGQTEAGELRDTERRKAGCIEMPPTGGIGPYLRSHAKRQHTHGRGCVVIVSNRPSRGTPYLSL